MHWIEAAQKAKNLLPADIGHGEKQTSLATVAQQLGLARQSLRNILAAYDFLESTRADPATYRSLSAMPNTSVEIYARWHKYDPVAALAHARRASAEGMTVKTIIGAEKQAKAVRIPKTISFARSLVDNYRALGRPEVFLHEEIRRHLRDLRVQTGPAAAWSLEQVEDSFSITIGIREAITFSSPHQRNQPGSRWRHIVGVIEVGERALSEGYRKLSKDIMTRAIAGTLAYPTVLVVAPDSDALAEMTGALPPPFLKQGGPAPPTFFVLAPCIGGILFTAADRAERDLYQRDVLNDRL